MNEKTMDLIREHLIYKHVPITICLNTLKSQEHYECIRLLLATRTKDVSVCLHDVQNTNLVRVFNKLGVLFIDCQKELQQPPVFDLQSSRNSLPL
jgi:hypothetical protein